MHAFYPARRSRLSAVASSFLTASRSFELEADYQSPIDSNTMSYSMAKQSTQKTYLTAEGLQKLKDELHHLRTAERARIADAIAEARAHGDLSENAEYDAAKEAQGHLEARISKLETTISNARVVDESQIDDSKAFILSTVKVKNHNTGSEQSFTLVSQEEADLAQQKISIKSPIGKGLLGKEIGDVVEIKVPAGKVKLEILDISR